MSKDSFVFYKSFAEACRELDAETFKETVLAMCDYAMDGEDPEITGVAKAIFTIAKPIIDKNNQRYENGKKGGRPKTETEPNDNQTKPNDNQTVTERNQTITKPEPNVNVNDNVTVNDKEKVGAKAPKKEKAPSRFNPPTLDEVKKYCEERHNGIDPQHFIDYYASQRWKKANGRPLADWKAAVRTWESKDKEKARSGTKHTFNTFEQRVNDYDDIEAKMMNRRESG